jgi:cell division septation protein DedD
VVIAEEVTGTKGTFTRVRVGPFATREQAVAAVLKIRSLGLEAQVLNPPPPKTPD